MKADTTQCFSGTAGVWVAERGFVQTSPRATATPAGAN